LLASQSDDRLLALVRQGHERAFEALVHRYRKPLLSYCRRLPLPDARAEDIIQLALLKTWIAVREGAEVRDVKAWLYRVVHNTAVNAVRDSAHDGEPLADPVQRVGAAETDVDRRLAVREALTEVAALPPLQREVIVRTAVAGHSHEQVASDLGITNGAVRGLLYRARATLRTAVTALTPPPLLGWLAGRADPGGPAPERLTELAGGGGAVGIGGLLLKGGVVALTAGTVITGTAVVHIDGSSHHRNRHRLIASAPAGATATGPLVAETHSGSERGGRSVGLRSKRPASRREPGRGGVKAHAPGRARLLPVGGGHRAPRLIAQPRRVGEDGAPGSGKTVQSTGAPGSAGQGSSPSGGSGQSGESGQSGAGQSGASGQGGGSPGQAEPVGSAAGNGSGSGTGGSGSAGQGSGEGGGAAPGGGQPGGSSGSGSPEGSGGQGSSSPSGSEPASGSSGEGSGSLVGTVVHEVGSILEHVLH
jgi:RNA polymerase sigma factor (sigma-70 family)